MPRHGRHRDDRPAARRPAAAASHGAGPGVRPAAADSLRGPGRGRARACRAWPGRAAEADGRRRGGPHPIRAARGGQPRPAQPAGLGEGLGHVAAQRPRPSGADEARAELLATADESLDRLTRLIENLLDMSRLEAGALARQPRAGRPRRARAAGARRARPRGAHGAGEGAGDAAGGPRGRGAARAGAGQPAGQRPALQPARPAHRWWRRAATPVGSRSASSTADPAYPSRARRADVRAVPATRRPRHSTGVGLGLALSQGLTAAMGGTLTAEDTPGGGLTMTVTLPSVDARSGRDIRAHTGLHEPQRVRLEAGEHLRGVGRREARRHDLAEHVAIVGGDAEVVLEVVGQGLPLLAVVLPPLTPAPATNITLPQPWSSPRLPFSCVRRPNSLIVTSVTLSAWSPRSPKNAASAVARSCGVAEHLAAAQVAEVDVHVPVALVDGDHLDADVAADDPCRRGQRLAERRSSP